jgi:hypothetical protein
LSGDLATLLGHVPLTLTIVHLDVAALDTIFDVDLIVAREDVAFTWPCAFTSAKRKTAGRTPGGLA